MARIRITLEDLSEEKKMEIYETIQDNIREETKEELIKEMQNEKRIEAIDDLETQIEEKEIEAYNENDIDELTKDLINDECRSSSFQNSLSERISEDSDTILSKFYIIYDTKKD